MKANLALLVGVYSLLISAGCFKLYNPTNTTDIPANLIKIGLCLPFEVWPEFVFQGGADTILIHLDYLSETTQLLPNVTVQVTLFDSGDTPPKTYRSAMAMEEEGFAAYMGCGYSGITQPAAMVWSSLLVPHCDGGITSPMYSNKEDYPTLFRPIPNDNLFGSALVDVSNYFGWKRVSVIYGNDAYGQGLLDAFTALAKEKRIQIVTQKAFFPEVQDLDWTQPLQDIIDAEVTIVVYLGYYDNLYKIIQKASDMNMLTGKFAWLVTDLLALLYFDYDFPVNKTLLEGVLSLDYIYTSRPREYTDFLPYWRERITKAINMTIDTEDTPAYSTFYMTCSQLLLNGFHHILSNGSGVTLEHINQRKVAWKTPDDFLINSSMTISGPLTLDKNGDRTGFFSIITAKDLGYQAHSVGHGH
jgi:hypothetical protein